METECSKEINDNIENITAFKIFFHTFMHKTKWEIYHIPKNDEQNVEKIEINNENLNKNNINTIEKTDNNND